MVDSRFRCKLTDVCLKNFYIGEENKDSEHHYKSLKGSYRDSERHFKSLKGLYRDSERHIKSLKGSYNEFELIQVSEELQLSFHAESVSDLQWTSPEMLRNYYSDLSHVHIRHDVGTQPGDIYSIGVIIKEIFARNDPYAEHEDMGLMGKTVLTRTSNSNC